ncbi:MAG: 1-acyl-sn-glycerol-3-phosphate acyltransferase [Pseudomonadota bacterium]
MIRASLDRRQKLGVLGAGLCVLVVVYVVGLFAFAAMMPRMIADATSETDAIVRADRRQPAPAQRVRADGRAPRALAVRLGRQSRDRYRAAARRGRAEGRRDRLLRRARRTADDTIGNAAETAEFVHSHAIASLRLVTASYHMPRALLELRRALPEVRIVEHPVFPAGFARTIGGAGPAAPAWSCSNTTNTWPPGCATRWPISCSAAATARRAARMLFIRSLAFNLLFYAWIVAMGLPCLPLMLLPRRYAWWVVKVWTYGVLWLARRVVGLDYVVLNQPPLDGTRAIVAAKHQSAWDTLIFLVLLDDPAYVIKRELFRIPIYGWFTWRLGMIGIDRARAASALKRLVAGARRCSPPAGRS